jgi:D-methionine transport system ATP-binding protein
LDWWAGDRIGIVGATGAGKTSLLRVLVRLEDPSTGSYAFAGQEVRQWNPVILRRQVALVPAEPRLLGMTVAEAIAYPLQLRGCAPAEVAATLDPWRDRLGIPHQWDNRRDFELSLGERQRVAIARALVNQPEVLLLDDALSGLDLAGRDRLWDAIAGFTVAIVSHYLDEFPAHVTRCLHLQQGHIVTDQPTDQVDWAAIATALRSATPPPDPDWDNWDE